MSKKRNSSDDRADIRLLNENEETCTIRKDVRGSHTEENANQMPDEDRSSHRFSAFTQIAEKKRMLFPFLSSNCFLSLFFFFCSKNRALFKP